MCRVKSVDVVAGAIEEKCDVEMMCAQVLNSFVGAVVQYVPKLGIITQGEMERKRNMNVCFLR